MELERYNERTLSGVQNEFKANDSLFKALVRPSDDTYKDHYVHIMGMYAHLRRHEEEFRHACRVAESFLSDFAKFAIDQAKIDSTQRSFLESVSGRAVIPPQAPSNETTALNNFLQERKRLLESILAAIKRYNEVVRSVHAYFHEHARKGFWDDEWHLGGFLKEGKLPNEISV